MSSYPNQPITAYDFQLETCDLSVSRRPEVTIDIASFVVEINIYEHIEKPYLTGNVVISDAAGMYSALRIKGIDRLKIGVKLPDDNAQTVERTFYIDHIVQATRTNDGEIVYTFHIVEEIAYLSSHIQVNEGFQGGEGYTGAGTEIITQVFRNYLGRTIRTQGDAPAGASRSLRRYREQTAPFRYIAPHITPLAVAEAIRARMVDEKNSPYYLYSSFAGNNTYLQSFLDMIDYNAKFARPFVYGQRNAGELDMTRQMYNIESYSDNNVVNISQINNAGFVNSMFYFYDVTLGTAYNPHHGDRTVTNAANVQTGAGNHWTAHGMFNSPNLIDVGGTQVETTSGDEYLRHLYPEGAKLPWASSSGNTETAFVSSQSTEVELLHNRPAAKQVINMISGCNYTDNYNTYNENQVRTAQGDYLRLVDAHGLRKWVTSDPIEFVVPGRAFISIPTGQSERPTSVGRVANLEFVTSGPDTSARRDEARSGSHLLYAARHMFSATEGYKVQFSAVKIATTLNGTPGADETVSEPIGVGDTNG